MSLSFKLNFVASFSINLITSKALQKLSHNRVVYVSLLMLTSTPESVDLVQLFLPILKGKADAT